MGSTSTIHTPVIVDGQIITWLNGNMIVDRGIQKGTVDKICFSHVVKYFLRERMMQTTDPRKLAHLGEFWTLLLFYQQRLWGFDQSEKMHDWTEIPHCKCSLGNYTSKAESNITPRCPVHRHRIF